MRAFALVIGLIFAGGYASASWGQGFGSPVGGSCPGGVCPTSFPSYGPELWGAPSPVFLPAPSATETKRASGKLTQTQFNAECSAYSAKHANKTWWETTWEDNTGRILVEKGLDGNWHYTVIDNDKTGKAASVTTSDGKKLEVKDLTGKAGIEETSDRPVTAKPNPSSPLANGVVPSKQSDSPHYVINGSPVARDTVKAVLENKASKINDISAKPWVVAVGDKQEQDSAEKAITPMQRKEVNFKGMTEADVKERGLKYCSDANDVCVTVTDPAGKTLHSQVGTYGLADALASGPITDRRYDPKKDPDLRSGGDFSLESLFNGKSGLPTWLLPGLIGGAAVWFYLKNQQKKEAAK